MIGTAALVDRLASDRDVIAWLNADYRLRSAFDPEVDGGETITHETTIREWRDACDLVPTRQLAAIMNGWFGCSEAREAWRRVLEPEDVRTVGDLAAFAAPRMRLADFAPLLIAGHSDAPSGAFFALRRLVAQQEYRVPDLRPSTRISSLTPKQIAVLGLSIAKLAPALTPEPVIVPYMRQRIGVILVLCCAVAFWAALSFDQGRLAVLAVSGAVLGILLARGRPRFIKFGTCETVGDIARAIANDRLPRSQT